MINTKDFDEMRKEIDKRKMIEEDLKNHIEQFGYKRKKPLSRGKVRGQR